MLLVGFLTCAQAASQVPSTQAARDAPLTLTATARALQPGELVVLTISTTATEENVHVRAFGHDVRPYRIDPHEWQALIGIDLDVAPGRYAVTADAGPVSRKAHATYELVVRARKFPTRNLTVNEAFVNPPASVTDRIASEAKELKQIWNSATAERLWTEPFVRPVPESANSAFGSRSVFNGQPRSPHGGADFLSPAGTPVKAPNAGRILIARDLYFTGNTVVIDHGLGLFSMLAHLSAIDVQQGDLVKAGAIVGRVGATGRVTGPHLHWAVRVTGARVDPLSLLAAIGVPKS
jgi:murein DD-endopeptidase MepM/ murein hydrolase activator NlpD